MSSGDEDDAWLPLGTSNTSGDNEGTGHDVFSAGSLRSAIVVSSQKRDIAAGADDEDEHDDVEVISRPPSSSSASTSMRAIQQRLETRQTLKANLVDQPLNHFFVKFIQHLARQLWSQDYYLRCGLALLAIGLTMQFLTFVLMGNDPYAE